MNQKELKQFSAPVNSFLIIVQYHKKDSNLLSAVGTSSSCTFIYAILIIPHIS